MKIIKILMIVPFLSILLVANQKIKIPAAYKASNLLEYIESLSGQYDPCQKAAHAYNQCLRNKESLHDQMPKEHRDFHIQCVQKNPELSYNHSDPIRGLTILMTIFSYDVSNLSFESKKQLIEHCLKAGIDINAKTINHESALTIAYRSPQQNKDTIEWLIKEKGADVNSGGEHTDSFFTTACKRGNIDFIKLALQYGAIATEKSIEYVQETNFNSKRDKKEALSLLTTACKAQK